MAKTIALTSSIISQCAPSVVMGKTLASKSDLNEVKTAGCYFVNVCTNLPTSLYSYGMLIVLVCNQITTQIYIPFNHNSNINTEKNMATRQYHSNRWSAWQTYAPASLETNLRPVE